MSAKEYYRKALFNPSSMSDEKQITAQPSGVPGLAVDVYFQESRIKMMTRLANAYHSAGCFTSDVKNPYQALVKIQAGAEMGMAPAEAMSSLLLIKGQTTIWGMAMTKRLRLHGWKVTVVKEDENNCEVKVTKGDESYSYKATADEVGKLKSNALKFAKKDKLFWHAISRIIRRHVPEVLGGGVQYFAEEILQAEPDQNDGDTFSVNIKEPEVVVEEPKKETKKSFEVIDEETGEVEEVETKQPEVIPEAEEEPPALDL